MSWTNVCRRDHTHGTRIDTIAILRPEARTAEPASQEARISAPGSQRVHVRLLTCGNLVLGTCEEV